jgi:hypothetical protein
MAVNELLLDVKWLEHDGHCSRPSSSEVRKLTAPPPPKNGRGKIKKDVMSGDLPLVPHTFL